MVQIVVLDNSRFFYRRLKVELFSVNFFSLVIERQPVPKFDHTEAIDETDDMRCGYPKRSRTRSWSKKGSDSFSVHILECGIVYLTVNTVLSTLLSGRIFLLICLPSQLLW